MPDYEKIAEEVSIPAPPTEELDGVVIPASAQREYLPLDHEKYQGIAASKGYDQSYSRIKRVHYSHEAMIDVIIANPSITQVKLAKTFEKSEAWISRIMGSDAFQAALAKRREDITDPFLVATVEERFRGLANQSLDVISAKLESSKNTDLALKALDISVKALGFGARGGGNTQQNQFIIQLPPKAQNSGDWLKNANPNQLPSGD